MEREEQHMLEMKIADTEYSMTKLQDELHQLQQELKGVKDLMWFHGKVLLAVVLCKLFF